MNVANCGEEIDDLVWGKDSGSDGGSEQSLEEETTSGSVQSDEMVDDLDVAEWDDGGDGDDDKGDNDADELAAMEDIDDDRDDGPDLEDQEMEQATVR